MFFYFTKTLKTVVFDFWIEICQAIHYTCIIFAQSGTNNKGRSDYPRNDHEIWFLLVLTGPNWDLLGLTGSYWALLGH